MGHKGPGGSGKGTKGVGDKTKKPEADKDRPSTSTPKDGHEHPSTPRRPSTKSDGPAQRDSTPAATPKPAPAALRPVTKRADPKPATPPPPGGAPRASGPATRRAHDESIGGWEEWWRVNGIAWSGGGAFWPSPEPGQTPDRVDVAALDPLFLRSTLWPRLAQRLHDEDPQVASAALLALARVAGARDGAMVAPLVVRALDDDRLVMRDAALVALGLCGDGESRAKLAAIAADSREGRALVDAGGPIDCSRRQLAALALGLAKGTESAAALLAVADSCDCEHITGAALLGAAHAAPENPAVASKLLATLADARATDFVRAQSAIAMSRVAPALARAALPMLVHLAGADDGVEAVRTAAVIALGALGRASDGELVSVLQQNCDGRGAPDVRSFSFMALGRLLETSAAYPEAAAAADAVAHFLGDRVFAPRLSYDRPFAALALGIGVRGEAGDSDRHFQACATLREALTISRNASTDAALGLALGLARDRAAVPELLRRLEIDAATSSAPYWAEALGLAGGGVAAMARRPLAERLDDDSSSPELRVASARALARLGSLETMERLATRLEGETSDASAAVLAEALGMFECRRSAGELVALLDDASTGRATRWQAVDSLARIGESAAPTWSAGYAIDSQYRLRTAALDFVLLQ